MKDSEVRIKEYKKVTTPKELLNFMDKYISYGIYGTDDKVYDDWNSNGNSEFQNACQTKYALCDENRLLKYGYGHCWDQVELERAWFKKHDYEYKTFFIWFCLEEKNNYVTHTYLVYKDNDKYYYFEHADESNKGIYEFDSYEDAIKFQMKKQIQFNKDCGNVVDDLDKLQVHEFTIEKYNIDQEEYIKNIINSKIIYKNNNFIDWSVYDGIRKK